MSETLVPLFNAIVGRLTAAITDVSASRLAERRLNKADLENSLRGILGDVGDMYRQASADHAALVERVKELTGLNDLYKADADNLLARIAELERVLETERAIAKASFPPGYEFWDNETDAEYDKEDNDHE